MSKHFVEGLTLWLEPADVVFLIDLLDVGIKHWTETSGQDKLTKAGLREATRRAMALQRKLQSRLNAWQDEAETKET